MKARKSVLLGLAAAIVAGAFVATPSIAEEATLRAVSCFPIGSPPGVPFEEVVAEINKRGEGVVKVDLLGGAPAVGSPFQVAERMALGAYDMVGCPEAYFGNLVPEAPVLRLPELSYAELRQNGAIDYFQTLMNAKGAYFIGRHHTDGKFFLYMRGPLNKPDLAALNLRVSPVYNAFFKALGATVQRSTMPEIYTLMENGTVDGFGWPLRAFSPSWYKVTNYRVGPGVYTATIHTIANLKKWDSLSQEARDIISGVVLEAEARVESNSDWSKAADAEQIKAQAAEGIETIEFEGADAEKWISTAREAAWDEVVELSPDHGAKLRELFTKSQ